ncbi:DUF309 domain-containing protein [Oceanidesulfovibrio marinus]|uniref:DUF309 domain-containing protein n=1 Tax=Oceanidesulfovibrio marinus TaxID=370038 RepID=A0A6P1ZM24_9BACT|nr:DUF309 domain-containing protein [Oceanidesulfovibrio marinus]QJT08306.1 DUF309 domain-containing protein [Oceanidesulfovibrio marinus]TVM35196.1 DUF309 domain-containing protein [Oceanidesulfovibrio marinus]
MTDVRSQCSEPAPELLTRAVAHFNNREFFATHDVLETLWLLEKGPVRNLYKGIIMIAGGMHHNQRGKRTGCLSLLQKGADYVAPYLPSCMGLDLERLVADARAALAWVTERQGCAPVPDELIPVIHPV